MSEGAGVGVRHGWQGTCSQLGKLEFFYLYQEHFYEEVSRYRWRSPHVRACGFVHKAIAFQQPQARPGASKRVVDFTAKLNGTTNSLGKTGVTPKIQSAAIAKDGTITVRATIVDSTGLPLDRLGVVTQGPVSMSFIAAYIPSGQTQYVAYTTTVLKPTLNLNMPAQTQAANDSGGTFVTNNVGDYTYTFKTKAPYHFRSDGDDGDRRLRVPRPLGLWHVR